MSKLANKVEVLENKTQPQKPSKSGPRFVNIDEIS